MKASTTEDNRKRRKQKTSLLKIVGSKKNGIQQKTKTRPIAARKRIQEADKIRNSFPESRYAFDQFIVASRGNEEIKQRQYQTLQQRQIMNVDMGSIQDSISHCDCLVCRRKSFAFAQQQQQWQNQNQIHMANDAWMFRKQQMSKYRHQQKTNTSLLAAQNKPEDSHYELARKRACLSTTAQNFQQSLTREAAEAAVSDYNFYQQNVNFYPKYITDHQFDNLTIKMNWPTVNMKQNSAQLTNVKYNNYSHSRYFPDYYNNHNLVDFISIPDFQGSHGSLTSSIESDGSDTNNIVTSQQLQMFNNFDCYNFVKS